RLDKGVVFTLPDCVPEIFSYQRVLSDKHAITQLRLTYNHSIEWISCPGMFQCVIYKHIKRAIPINKGYFYFQTLQDNIWSDLYFPYFKEVFQLKSHK
ncbi:MAG: hypothetical protein RIB86_25955, partial [Imperialibacter sp.]